MGPTTLSAILLALAGVVSCTHSGHAFDTRGKGTGLPVVDLEYEIYRATKFNTTGDYYTFSNIRYGAPPVGRLRFAAPQLPSTNRSAVQTGSQDRICPQAMPDWMGTTYHFLPRYLSGESDFDPSSFNSSVPLPLDPRETEDCLFLDVSVPKTILDHVGKGAGAPVLVWIHGGGYTIGSKSDSGNPAGLIRSSQNGIIFVSINYRLGAFGFLGGPTLQADGTANAGLHDQRMALEWVQSKIAKFGGDPKRVTVIGESAGGGSILHHLTAFNGRDAPFAQAIPQSPYFYPIVSNRHKEGILATFLNYTKVSSIQEARGLSSAALQDANRRHVAASQYGLFTYGPQVDGTFIPAPPAELLRQGRFDKTVRLMVGHNSNEGLYFTTPFLKNEADLRGHFVEWLPTLQGASSSVDYLTNTLYPGETDTRSLIERASKFNGDGTLVCTAYFLAKTYRDTSYAYQFSVAPGVHGTDLGYTFYNGPSSIVTAPETAIRLQKYMTNFALGGAPNGPGLPAFNTYGKDGRTLVLNETDATVSFDTGMEERCTWWEKGLYF